ncbi:MAG: glycosyltransferase [Hyphomicrobium sp.]|uniref:glycosyltransferase family 2 protein n=1 Tax=Hyphomicrobium sp. TaxID=82 RepID=UPI0039E635A4
MGAPNVSVIITNFNYAGFLKRSIGSALRQNYGGHIEIVVVDDKSTDNSREVIASFGDQIIGVLKDVNGGHGGAFNSGFAASKGDLVLFLDADDYIYPDAISTIVAAMRPEAAQYQYRLDLVDGQGTKLETYPPPETRMQDGDVRRELGARGRFATTVTSGLAFPRWCLEQILPMPPEDFRQGGDGFLVTVAPLYGDVITVPGVLGAYCQHGGNHSQFELAVAKRARWRLFHDEMRFKALRLHASKLDIPIAESPGLADVAHLTERLASLQLEPKLHPYKDDTAAKLSRFGLVALREAPLSPKRRQIMLVWWWVVTHVPRSVAGSIITWTLAAASRPAIIKRTAQLLRRLG